MVTAGIFLHRNSSNSRYALLVLGKNGEERKGLEVAVTVTHSHYTQPFVYSSLQTDASGRIDLEEL